MIGDRTSASVSSAICRIATGRCFLALDVGMHIYGAKLQTVRRAGHSIPAEAQDFGLRQKAWSTTVSAALSQRARALSRRRSQPTPDQLITDGQPYLDPQVTLFVLLSREHGRTARLLESLRNLALDSLHLLQPHLEEFGGDFVPGN